MFASYNTNEFGIKIKEIRTLLGHTQLDVSKGTRINIDTLRRIENGECIPRYDTLALLGTYYKMDINHLFTQYQQSHLLLSFLKSLDHLMLYAKFDEIKQCHQNFLVKLNLSKDLELVEKMTLTQIDYFIQASSLRYKEENQAALELTCSALKITNKDFEIENFKQFSYSSIEIRLLTLAANCLGELRKCELSNQIFMYILTIIKDDIYNEKAEDMIIVKALAAISYNYHRLDQNELALEYAQKGIEFSLRKGCMDLIYFLYIREGAAKYHLNDPSYIESFVDCLCYIRSTRNKENYNYMLNLIKDKFKVDLSYILS